MAKTKVNFYWFVSATKEEPAIFSFRVPMSATNYDIALCSLYLPKRTKNAKAVNMCIHQPLQQVTYTDTNIYLNSIRTLFLPNEDVVVQNYAENEMYFHTINSTNLDQMSLILTDEEGSIMQLESPALLLLAVKKK
jgi:hypothetical protein